MKKKRIFIILFIMILIVGLRYILSQNEQKKLQPITKDYEKHQKVDDFVAQEKGKDPNKEITTNESGYNGVLIKNKQVLFGVMKTDSALSLADRLSEGFKSISVLNKDSKELKDAEISKYFNLNKDSLSTILGIGDEATFAKFIKELSFIDDKESLKEALIDDKSLVKNENGEITFSIKLKTTNDKENTFNIKAAISKTNQKDIKLYWN